MSLSPRAEALSLVRSGGQIEPLPMPADLDLCPNSQAAIDYLNTIEGQRYAALARTIDTLLGHTLEMRLEREPDGLIKGESEVRELDGWQQLDLDFINTFITDVKSIRHTTEFKNSVKFARLFGALHLPRTLDLSTQLTAGADTASSSMLTLLRNAPHLIRRYDPDASDAEVASVMHHPQTKTLASKLAKGSVNQLMSARSALTGDYERGSWSDIDQVLNPQHFQLQVYSDGSTSMRYSDWSGLEVPAGYTPRPTVEPVQEATPVKDIKSNRPTVIGCPITLLEGRLAELFDWSIDIVESRGLWEEEWPPKVASIT